MLKKRIDIETLAGSRDPLRQIRFMLLFLANPITELAEASFERAKKRRATSGDQRDPNTLDWELQRIVVGREKRMRLMCVLRCRQGDVSYSLYYQEAKGSINSLIPEHLSLEKAEKICRVLPSLINRLIQLHPPIAPLFFDDPSIGIVGLARAN